MREGWWLNSLLSKLRLTRRKTLKRLIQEMMVETDRLFLLDLEHGSPMYNLQQSMMKNAARYRLAKINQLKEENKSGEESDSVKSS